MMKARWPEPLPRYGDWARGRGPKGTPRESLRWEGRRAPIFFTTRSHFGESRKQSCSTYSPLGNAMPLIGECNRLVELEQSIVDKLWSNNATRWKSKLPLDPHQPDLGSWLFAARANGKVTGLGCKACHLQRLDSPFGKAFLRTRRQCMLSRFVEHEKTTSHIRAVVALTGCDECRSAADDSDERRSGPTTEEFKLVWDSRRGGGAAHRKLKCGKFVIQRWKKQRIEFVLAEAVRMIQREHIKKSVALCTHTDGKGKRLTMRFSSTNTSLRTMKGLVGHVLHAGQHNDATHAYVASLDRLFRRFCTIGYGAPRGAKSANLIYLPQDDPRKVPGLRQDDPRMTP